MDVRGVEVTNQLRSAIRAKLLELGVRYDEELPDYILVMVVNKKTRQQMHEDLHLFLEDSTTPFVDWLHDQVLKKLQKVTIAKKKATREFLPTVVVKQEEERKKRKISGQSDDLKVKEETLTIKSTSKLTQTKLKYNSVNSAVQQTEDKVISSEDEHTLSKNSSALPIDSRVVKSPTIRDTLSKNIEKNDKQSENLLTNSNKLLDNKELENPVRPEKKTKSVEQSDESETEEKKLKSCVNKPRITSVISVKTRLGLTSPRNKFDIHRDRMDNDHRRVPEKRVERRLYEPVNRRENFRGRNNEDETPRRAKDESKTRQMITTINNKIKNSGASDSSEKPSFSSKSRIETVSGTIKDRLGLGGKSKHKETTEDFQRNVKNRLGPVKSKFIALGRLGGSKIVTRPIVDDLFEEEAEIDDEEASVAPVKSHIIAVKNPVTEKLGKSGKALKSEEEKGNDDGKALASKVIVTPRPLKPLQPVQKRATQSLLLRAVAEANQSVVKQKNPEPILEKNQGLKRLKPSNLRVPNQNLAVHLNANKRLVMEKIQVELTTSDGLENNEPEPYVPRAVTEEQMDVVMSLFQRGNDNQKFLVTLNGYNNNNGTKEKNFSDDDERLEMEVTEDDELLLANNHSESCVENELSLEAEEEADDTPDKSEIPENNENHCSENLEVGVELPRKRRKLSPIVYTRSRSPSPTEAKNNLLESIIEKKILNTTSSPTEKSREKCRYWPNCTLGAKCSFTHPSVPCSVFPACKFGDKCAYKHPKCKFGLSCTKLGCVFSHPSQQCKYHPFCTKPGCMYLHPQAPIAVTPETVRAKFTWRRRD